MTHLKPDSICLQNALEKRNVYLSELLIRKYNIKPIKQDLLNFVNAIKGKKKRTLEDIY